LHRKSGIPADKISEVHGNNNLEVCMECSKGYMRDY
jgi:mono-ADP-ribosyltransferase sirtuin 6